MTHACRLLAELDCAAAAGDRTAATLARFHVTHAVSTPLSAEDECEQAEVQRAYDRAHSPAA